MKILKTTKIERFLSIKNPKYKEGFSKILNKQTFKINKLFDNYNY